MRLKNWEYIADKGNIIDLGDGINNRDGNGGIFCIECDRQESELTNSINLFG